MQFNAAAIEHQWQCVEFNVNVQQWNKKILELKQYSQKSNQKLLCSLLRAENG